MLDLHQLSCFTAVYRHKSISRAAETMFISQQAVSHSLRELEKKLGGALFERSAGGVVPTPLGQALIADATALLDGARMLEEKAALLNRRSAGLSLAYADGIFSVGDAADLGALRAYAVGELGLPLTLLERTTGECLAMLRSGEADILCIFNPPAEGALVVRELCAYPLYVGMKPGHPLAQREAITPAELGQYPLICDQRDETFNAMMAAYSSIDGLQARLYAPSAQHSAFADILRRDDSLLMFTLPFVRAYAGPDAVIRPYAMEGAPLRLCAVYPERHPQREKLERIAAWLGRQYRSA